MDKGLPEKSPGPEPTILHMIHKSPSKITNLIACSFFFRLAVKKVVKITPPVSVDEVCKLFLTIPVSGFPNIDKA